MVSQRLSGFKFQFFVGLSAAAADYSELVNDAAFHQQTIRGIILRAETRDAGPSCFVYQRTIQESSSVNGGFRNQRGNKKLAHYFDARGDCMLNTHPVLDVPESVKNRIMMFF